MKNKIIKMDKKDANANAVETAERDTKNNR
jgi:hypothetical protein